MFRFKKIFKDLKFGVLKPKIFIILFVLFFSSLAIAATLSVTWIDGRIPQGLGDSTACTSYDGDQLNSDSTEDPSDVHFSDDGLRVFTTNAGQARWRSVGDLSMNILSRANELNSSKTDNGSNDCNDLNAFRVNLASGSALDAKLENIEIVDNGKKFFIMDIDGELGRFDLSTPNDFSTRTYVGKLSFSDEKDSFALSRDGTKVFTLNSTNDAPVVTTWSLVGPYDVSSSATNISQIDLTDVGITLTGDGVDNGRDIEFNDTGSAMFILISNDDTDEGSDLESSFIYQFKLGKNFDVSTATFVGRWNVANFGNISTGIGMPRGFSFSSDGMKMFIVQIQTGGGIDQINQFDLECPYGIVACTSDSTSSIGSQVELSKQNISLNVSTIFKRFEWIKRNRNSNNLNNLKASIKFDNPMLNYWVKKLPTKIVSINGPVENGKSITIGSENKNSNNLNNFATTIKSDNPLLSSWMNKLPKNITALKASLKEKSGKDKKSNWSYWSLGDLSINSYDKLGFEKAKNIKTKGLTFGADRKFGDNKFVGLALRYGDNKSNSISKQSNDMESLTLNIYGIMPVNEDQYINAVIGLSALRFDNKYLDKLSGERNGKQAFTSINYRTKNTYGKLNITPTGKFTYGVTRLSEFTDFLSTTIDAPTTDIIYAEDTFGSGEFSAGFLFEMDKIENDKGTFQPMGGIEILYDLSSDIDYKYTYVGSTEVNKDTILGKYSKRSLKTEVGFEMIYLNGFTISPMYERTISLSNDNEKKLYSERFIVKLSRSKEEDNSEFALDFDPLSDNPVNLIYAKNLNGFDIKINSNYSLLSKIPDYGANIEVSNNF